MMFNLNAQGDNDDIELSVCDKTDVRHNT